MNIFGFVLPILVIILCYSFILIDVKQKSKGIKIKVLNSSTTTRQEIFDTSFNRFSCYETSILNNSNTNELYVERYIYLSRTMSKRSLRKKINSIAAIEWKITKTAIILVITFCASWCPYAIISIIAQVSSKRENYVTLWTGFLPVLMAKLSSLSNPIFMMTNKKFKKSMLFFCRKVLKIKKN